MQVREQKDIASFSEIIKEKPSWLIRNGISFFLAILCIFVISMNFITYKELVKIKIDRLSPQFVFTPGNSAAAGSGEAAIMKVEKGDFLYTIFSGSDRAKKVVVSPSSGYLSIQKSAAGRPVYAIYDLTDTLRLEASLDISYKDRIRPGASVKISFKDDDTDTYKKDLFRGDILSVTDGGNGKLRLLIRTLGVTTPQYLALQNRGNPYVQLELADKSLFNFFFKRWRNRYQSNN